MTFTNNKPAPKQPKRLIHKHRSTIDYLNDVLKNLYDVDFCKSHQLTYKDSLELIIQILNVKTLCRINYNIEHLK